MKTYTEVYDIVDFPCWALPLLINGDYSGLMDEEIKLVEKFEDELREQVTHSYSNFLGVHYDAGTETDFCEYPEIGFGLAADCVKLKLVVNLQDIKSDVEDYLIALGFDRYGTGGGCEVANLEIGDRSIWITEHDDAAYPDSWSWDVGVYETETICEGECLAMLAPDGEEECRRVLVEAIDAVTRGDY